MKVRELIDTLKNYNQDAPVEVIAHNRGYPFTLTWGGGEGCIKEECADVGIYVDALCVSEEQEDE